jgi:hypothetical protein
VASRAELMLQVCASERKALRARVEESELATPVAKGSAAAAPGRDLRSPLSESN